MFLSNVINNYCWRIKGVFKTFPVWEPENNGNFSYCAAVSNLNTLRQHSLTIFMTKTLLRTMSYTIAIRAGVRLFLKSSML